MNLKRELGLLNKALKQCDTANAGHPSVWQAVDDLIKSLDEWENKHRYPDEILELKQGREAAKTRPPKPKT